ncbi:MAG: mandelate racemase/muconate lactonizing enzyme family protein [Faecousia sp.]
MEPRITKIEVFSKKVRQWWRVTGCRIYTDMGIYGDGESGLSFGDMYDAAYGAIKDISHLIIGMSALDNEAIWNKLHRQVYWGINGGPVVFSAISAIDIALWDIRGKYFRVPVYKLLGGKMRDGIRCYASQIQYGWGQRYSADWQETYACSSPEQMAVYARNARNEGFDAIKVDCILFTSEGEETCGVDHLPPLSPKTLELFESRLAAIRNEVGPYTEIILENHGGTSAQSAAQMSAIAKKYHVSFMEEACYPMPWITERLWKASSVSIAHGERIYSRWQFLPYLQDGSVQLIQPDVGICGGLTEAKKIAELAYLFDVVVQYHLYTSPLCASATLHLESVIPNFYIHEYAFELAQPYTDGICKYNPKPINGMLYVSEEPGIGNEWTESFIASCEKHIMIDA